MADFAMAMLKEAGAAGCEVVELGDELPAPAGPGIVRIGVHRSGPRPDAGLDAYDILLTADVAAPAPWVGVPALDAALAGLEARIEAQGTAAAVAAQVLRMTLALPFDQALIMESLAYSTLLASDGFKAWRKVTPRRTRENDDASRLLVDRSGDALHIRLNRPAARNAFDARMRDELCEALELGLAHDGRVVMTGAGPAFSAGGDLDEFGTADDVGRAHLIRTLQSPARLVNDLGERLTVVLHGACVGAGIEVGAAAARIVARPGTVCRLPEVSMGLIPGAGGTATIPRRIGRHRACWMAISGAELDLATALAWRLVDEVAT